ncbi:tspO/MBR-related protein [Rhizoctonia solani]|uniref:TspO/MBR-related protein n=1 Tax=Rhizoctonia solani TaxID=456999 RepID=A0A8H8NPD0_9AGAM|nr:tspO/MBR-related protein [Rhizoctonia solani]QRW16155.1 tspO/MBR-related protein [Rhizoctonia solani]
MLTFEPKHTQPFTFEHACQLDAPTISEEISRLHNSLRVLSSTQKQLQEAMAAETTPDVDLQEAYRENLEVIGSQEERIVMLRKALEARGAAVADNPHYQDQPLPLLLNLPRNPAVAVGLPIILGSLSGYPTAKVVKSGWYESLRAPPGRPPRQAFGIVWPILYASMGYASHLAIKTYDTSLSPAIKDAALTGLKMYWVQLGLNLAWTPLFFLWKQAGIALIDIAALTSTVAAMTHTLHEPTGGTSTYLLAPYCAWLSFATYLNGGYWWLNRGTPTGPATSFPRREE